MYEVVSKYLRENRGAGIQQVSDETEVPVRQIVKFIREGRISIMNMPNMSIPCESCGISIREGHLCDDCRKKLSRDVRHLSEDEKREQALKQQQDKRSNYNINDK